MKTPTDHLQKGAALMKLSSDIAPDAVKKANVTGCATIKSGSRQGHSYGGGFQGSAPP